MKAVKLVLVIVVIGGAEDGAALYEKKCAVCHSLAGKAGKFADKGGPLDGVGNKRDEAWLRAYFSCACQRLTVCTCNWSERAICGAL